jgi:hypothetical protein
MGMSMGEHRQTTSRAARPAKAPGRGLAIQPDSDGQRACSCRNRALVESLNE